MSKGKYPIGDDKARRAARKERKAQRAAARQARSGGTRKGSPGAAER
jgi:hypothetical protein